MDKFEDLLNFKFRISLPSNEAAVRFITEMCKKIDKDHYITMNEALALIHQMREEAGIQTVLEQNEEFEVFGWTEVPDFLFKARPDNHLLMDRPTIIMEKYEEMLKRRENENGEQDIQIEIP